MLTVCNYHYIREKFDTKYPSIFGVTPDLFKKQLQLFKSKGEFVLILDLVSNLDEVLNSDKNYYLITFDDGLKEQYINALPILDSLDIPALFFANSINFDKNRVTTVHKIHLLRSIIPSNPFLEILSKENNAILSSLEEKTAIKTYCYDDIEDAKLKYILNFKLPFDIQELLINKLFCQYFDEKEVLESLYMNKNEIIELAKRGYLGSHTHSHYPLGLLKEEEVVYELEKSKKYFEKLTNSEIKTVSYPYGTAESLNDFVIKTAKRVGYKVGFTTTRGVNDTVNEPYLLNRFDCNDLIGGKNYK